MRYLVIGALVIGVAVVSYMGCNGVSDRLGVASDKAIAKIDKLLGEIDVKKKALDRGIKEADAQVDTMKSKLYEAKANVNRYGSKKAEMEARKAKLLSQLKEIAPMLKTADGATEVEFRGKKVSIQTLDTLAKAAVNEVENLKGSISKNAQIYNAWAKNLTVLEKNVQVSTAQLEKFKSQMVQIQAKKDALDGMKVAASIAEPGVSISDKFDTLSNDIEELLVSVDGQFEQEVDKVNERIAELDESNVSATLDELLNDKNDVSGTVSDIDKLLSEEGGN